MKDWQNIVVSYLVYSYVVSLCGNYLLPSVDLIRILQFFSVCMDEMFYETFSGRIGTIKIHVNLHISVGTCETGAQGLI